MTRAVLAFAFVLTACAHWPGTPKPLVDVTLTHAADEVWRVSYRLPAAVRELKFERAHYPFRAENWRVTTPGVKLVDGVLSAATPFDRVDLEIPSFARSPEKDYQLFLPYTDGSALVFTAAFDIADHRTQFTLVPREGERIVLNGEVHDGVTHWLSNVRGTYAYFGKTTPVQSPDMVGVIDDGCPGWLREKVATMFPRLFAWYALKTGHKLDFKPVVYLSCGPDATPHSISTLGNVLPQMVELDVRLGSAFTSDSPVVIEHIAHLLAHESAHFWNGQMFHHEDNQDWLHEGGADAFADRALRELGVYDDAQYRDRQSRAVSSCMLGLDGASLNDSSRAGRFHNYYTCGSVIALMTELALARAHAPLDLFAFWGRVFDRSKDHQYDANTYLRLLEKYDPHVAEQLVELIDTPLADPSVIVSELRQLGATITEVNDADVVVREARMGEDYRRIAGIEAARHLLRADCGDAAALDCFEDHCSLDAGKSCHVLKGHVDVRTVGGIDIFQHGVEAYDQTVASCAQRRTIIVNDTPIACDRPLRPRPPYVTIDTLPKM
jgi:hypothetical protein